MQFDNSLRYGEPKSCAALLFCDRIVGLLKFLEQLGLIGLEIPGPVSRTATWNDPLAEEPLIDNLSNIGELDRIAHEIEQHLRKPAFIAVSLR